MFLLSVLYVSHSDNIKSQNDPCLLWQQGHVRSCSQTSPCKYPCNAISNDYPVYAELQAIIEALHPLQLQLHHVVGYQDTKSDKPSLDQRNKTSNATHMLPTSPHIMILLNCAGTLLQHRLPTHESEWPESKSIVFSQHYVMWQPAHLTLITSKTNTNG